MITLALPVVDVTLFEDRAVVRRRGTLHTSTDARTLTVPGVSPIIVDKSLHATLCGDTKATVRQIRVERTVVTEDHQRPQAMEILRTRRRDAEQRADTLKHHHHTAVAALRALRTTAALTLEDIALDAAYGESNIDHWHTMLGSLDERITTTAARVAELETDVRDIELEIRDIEAELSSSTSDPQWIASLVIDLSGDDTPSNVELELAYTVAGAAWRPWHEARLSVDDDVCTFRTDACIWQATGEDWNDVQLHFSTERPSLGTTPPPLTDDLIHKEPRGSIIDVETRDQTIEAVDVHTGAIATHAESAVLGIDDGGETRELKALGPATIKSTGQPHRVPVFEFVSSATTRLVCFPELDPVVVLQSTQSNTHHQPILAGPVDLIHRGGLVGRTSTLFIPPQQMFELGWGPQPDLRVHREVESLETSRRAISSWSRRPRRVTVKLSNLSATWKTIEVAERIPVSETEKVVVELIAAHPPASADGDGIVRWTVTIPGWAHQTTSVEWAIAIHDQVAGLDL